MGKWGTRCFKIIQLILYKQFDMENISIRQQLHHLIDLADDVKVKAMYDFYQSSFQNEKYNQSQLAEFYNTLEKYEKGEMPVYPVSEAHDYIRAYKN